ncbi:MAG: ABC transporter permease [Defluviitaleaceae bacterium]|nr:ABC transporter permease [Defluviitaleaceae bacterium]
MLIFLHYLRRTSLDPIGLLIFILMPVVLVFLNVEINVANIDFGGHVIATVVVLQIMMMFQLMAGSYICEYVCLDLQGETRWRLLAAPVALNKYLFGALAASLLFTLVSGGIILLIGAVVYDIYVGNIGFVVAAMVLTALFGQFLGVILSVLIKKSGTAVAAHIGISWAIFILSGFFGRVRLPVIGDLLSTHGMPYSAALRAVLQSGVGQFVFDDYGMLLSATADTTSALTGLAALAGFAAVTGIVAWLLGRRRLA